MKKFTPKQIRTRALLLFATGLILAWGGVIGDGDARVIVPGIFVMIGALVYHILNYRCPHCGKYLDRSTGDYCPRCGKNVNRIEEAMTPPFDAETSERNGEK